MDEPFSALDAQNKLLLQEELLRIWDEHKKTVVFITHSVDEAVLLGDRIMVMTAQPGKVKTFVPVPLARPRNIMELQKTPEYGELVTSIWSSLRDEVQRARQPGGRRSRHERAEPMSSRARGAPASMSARTRDRLLNVVSPLALLLVWELCARFGFIDTRFFPAPSSDRLDAWSRCCARASSSPTPRSACSGCSRAP